MFVAIVFALFGRTGHINMWFRAENPYNIQMKAKELLRQASLILKAAGLDGPGAEAMALLRELADIDARRMYADNPEVAVDISGLVLSATRRRAAHEPLQYITGTVEFMGMPLSVGPGVLVPRPETELLVEEVFCIFPDPGAHPDVLDLCTGSGCIALAIARRYPGARVTATDSSGEALSYARINAQEIGLSNLRLLEGSLFEPVEKGLFDLIVSNPPYIPEGEIDGLMPEVSRYEPRGALSGGGDGLDFYRAIIEGAPERLRPGGVLVFELGAGQRAAVESLALAKGLSLKKAIKDLVGHERVLVLVN